MTDNGLKTNGISPKVIAAVIAAVIAYILGQEILELPSWAVVAGQAVLIAIAAWMARPGDVIPDTRGIPPSDTGYHDERGQTNVWFLLGALTVAVIVLAAVVLT